ncbi:MAG: glycosyltransferase family 9 protein [Muribaculaceae bacterium]|nr:glycosyltransferase family 9 protein [Muribaculaceae bacterium]
MGQNKPACVLVTRFSALGDVAMAIPVLYDACRANPGVRFVFASRPWAAALAQQPPSNLTVVPVDLKKEYNGLWGMVRLARRLRRDCGVDALADLHNVMRTWVMGAVLRLAGVSVRRIDKGRREKHDLVTAKLNRPLTHTTERYRLTFERIGIAAPRQFTTLFTGNLPPCTLAGDKPVDTRWIAVAPFSAHEGKVYPLDKMRQVVAALAARDHTHVFLMGGGEHEKTVLDGWAGDHHNVTNVAAVDHTFADELALLARCDLMVSMDSANMHLASLVGLRTLSVWGATHPHCGFMGYRQRDTDAVQLPLHCRPCSVFGDKPCRSGGYPCLNGITPDMIVDKVNEILYGQ